MIASRKLFFTGAAVFGLLSAGLLSIAGCGGGENAEESPPAAIPGPGGAGGGSLAAAEPGAGPSKSDEDPLHPVVLIDTSLGAITVRLDAEKAPLTVDNFLWHARAGHYDQTIFHQVFKGQGILGGGYTADMAEKYSGSTTLRNEADNGLKNRRGTIAMVRSADVIDSARAQFFFNLSDNESLDHTQRTAEGYGYCVFGEVTGGLDVLDRIANVPVHDTEQFERAPVETVMINAVKQLK